MIIGGLSSVQAHGLFHPETTLAMWLIPTKTDPKLSLSRQTAQ